MSKLRRSCLRIGLGTGVKGGPSCPGPKLGLFSIMFVYAASHATRSPKQCGMQCAYCCRQHERHERHSEPHGSQFGAPAIVKRYMHGWASFKAMQRLILMF